MGGGDKMIIKRYSLILTLFGFLFLFPALGFCTDYDLTDVKVNVGDAAQVAGAGLSGCAVMWGFRKAIKTINRC